MEAVRAEAVRVWEDEQHLIHVTVNGEDFAGVRAVSVFPLTGAAEYVSFLDEDGREVAMLADPGNLDKPSRKALEKALSRMYYVARITHVFRVSETHGVSLWEVMTDRGYAEFEILSREHIRELPGKRYIITDADGNRFEIPRLADLDAESYARVQSET